MPVHIYRGSTNDDLGPSVTALKEGSHVSPWVDATKENDGKWQLPTYPCEIKGIPDEDPKKKRWTPGEYEDGVDNKDVDENNQVREWGGMKMWAGDKPPRDWDINRYPENVQALLKVPHMPGQPVKEMFARRKALDPRPFEDKYFEEVLRDMVPEWPALVRRVRYAESFGIHNESEPSEWAGQEDEVVPAAYRTPRHDTVTVCAGIVGYDSSAGQPATVDIPGTEYDYLEFLYAKDQEGKLIQIMTFPNYGMHPCLFHTFSFVPPMGTAIITPFACFKIRGVWKGSPMEWNPLLGSEEMQWFTDMSPELREHLTLKEGVVDRTEPTLEE